MNPKRMTLTISARGKASANTSLQEVQAAVRKALRESGVEVGLDAVEVTGALTSPLPGRGR
jgi:hypothetical protein